MHFECKAFFNKLTYFVLSEKINLLIYLMKNTCDIWVKKCLSARLKPEKMNLKKSPFSS